MGSTDCYSWAGCDTGDWCDTSGTDNVCVECDDDWETECPKQTTVSNKQDCNDGCSWNDDVEDAAKKLGAFLLIVIIVIVLITVCSVLACVYPAAWARSSR